MIPHHDFCDPLEHKTIQAQPSQRAPSPTDRNDNDFFFLFAELFYVVHSSELEQQQKELQKLIYGLTQNISEAKGHSHD
jgi:hypothetical protein